MSRKHLPLLWLLFVLLPFTSEAQGLKNVLAPYCLVGAALNQNQSDGRDSAATAIVDRHFSCAVAENCMKSGSIQHREGVFDFQAADNFVNYCEQHNLVAIGHCLVWHSQAPTWFFTDKDGQPVTRQQLIERLQSHIRTVVGRYRGRVHGWDVVNEAIEDDGSFRRSPFYNIIGEDFIEIAFRTAHEADPDAELYYNDYSMANPQKREGVCRLVRRLQQKGLRIDGVGMQSHVGLNYPSLNDYEQSLVAFSQLGVKVMITELDLNVLPQPERFSGAAVEQNYEYQARMNPYADGLPSEKAKEAEERYMDFFRLFYKHRDKISRINFWGISDGGSWLNNWPVHGRTNYPLPFDRQYNAKPVIGKIIDLYQK